MTSIDEILGRIGSGWRIQIGTKVVNLSLVAAPGLPAGGAQGYAVAGTCSDGTATQDVIVKIFCNPWRKRLPNLLATHYQRSLFLQRQQVWKWHPTLFAAPFMVYSDLPFVSQDISGHVARRVRNAQSFDAYLLTTPYRRPERLALAAQLMGGVAAMEQHQLVHGDLSQNNVLIERLDDGHAHLRMIDFDAFVHGSAPELPEKARPLGTAGYRSPISVARAIQLPSDRFGAAVMAIELLALEPADCIRRFPALFEPEVDELDRSVLAEPFLRRAGLPFVELLRRSLEASDLSGLPDPEEWLTLIEDELNPPSPIGNDVRLLVFHGQRQVKSIRVTAPRHAMLDKAGLPHVRLNFENGNLRLMVPPGPWLSRVASDGRRRNLGASGADFAVGSGETIHFDNISLRCQPIT